MPRVSTFCPRCGETIETELPAEARAAGRAELTCPACRFVFVIGPAHAAAPSRPAPGPAPWPVAPGAPAPPPQAGTTVVTPAPAGGRATPSLKPVAAGLMLVFAAAIGGYMGGILVGDADLAKEAFQGVEGTGNLTGRVVDGDGEPIAGVRVLRLGASDNTSTAFTTTDADGRYNLSGIPHGVHEFRFEKSNYTTLVYEVPIYPEGTPFLSLVEKTLGHVVMKEGDPDTIRSESLVEDAITLARAWGVFILVCSALALAGGVAAFRRRWYPLAVTGAVAGVLTFGLVVGSVLSVIALVLIIIARKEFVRRAPQTIPGPPPM